MNSNDNSSPSSRFLAGFRRITSSGQFIPEIDGLRFIAIVAVILYHITFYLGESNNFAYANPSESFKQFLPVFKPFWHGVQLFFVISGFILALPFAFHFLRQAKAVSLKQYYTRRLTRLEPPYLFAMILCFAFIWYRLHAKPESGEYLSSFVASLFYSHNFFWPRDVLPLVNPVAWSLEVEVQFYLLAPLIAYCFTLGKTLRRALLLLPAVVRLALPEYFLPHITLIDYVQFFLVGFVLADLYVNDELKPAGKQAWPGLLGALSFAAIWFAPIGCLPFATGLFCYSSFKSSFIRHLLSNRWVTTIGGMCYSLYLIHWVLITTFGGRLVRKFTDNYALDFLIHAALLAAMILVVGALFFKFIERPCMARDWHKRLAGRIKSLRPARRRTTTEAGIDVPAEAVRTE